ncbi:RiPP maturation radical SAM C-methyltransferase [Lysinibacillus xylanilyticus]|uniref:RiPP maturation radical SAM C-methyltransferase n=1 Tax=Lysinibacillus xylanilyticus TaxID=582475 RepID=UPI003CFC50F5
MKVLLVSMPWASVNRPSLALGVLTAAAGTLCEEEHIVDQYNANIKWVEYTNIETSGELDTHKFARISDNYFLGVGEWIFTNALYDVEIWRKEEFLNFAKVNNFNAEIALKYHKLAPKFINLTAKELAFSDYDLIGFSSSFLQNVPSLALAKKIKEMNPCKKIVFGGANCDGIQGITLHKNFPFVDYVIRGEGELAFSELLDNLEKNNSLDAINGLCWRGEKGESISNKDTLVPIAMNQVPQPIYKNYFEDIQLTGIYKTIEPELILESSRGCWWGQKHQCTFCGLNGNFMNYRSKDPDKVIEEITNVVKEHRILNISFADNILDMKYFKSLLPKIKELDWDINMFFEIKANITYEQVKLLKEAGVKEVQPGIENLSTNVLKIMDKGVNGVQNVKLLRNCKEVDLKVDWNYLFGFPKETDADYEYILNQLQSLVHLEPPIAFGRVALERFSPYFNNSELGFVNLGPSKIYSYIYDLPTNEIEDLVYIFESPHYGISSELEREFEAAIENWKKNYKISSLTFNEDDYSEIITITDNRFSNNLLFKLNSIESKIYKTLLNGYSIESLQNRLNIKYNLLVEKDYLQNLLSYWLQLGIIFTDGENYISLAIEESCVKITTWSEAYV